MCLPLKTPFPGSQKTRGYTSNYKTSSHNPHAVQIIETENQGNLVPFFKMSLADRMDKIIKLEAEMLLKLELQRNQAEDILLDQRGLRISAQVTRRFLEKLEAATINYEQAITKLIISKEMNSNSRTAYTNKSREQQKLTNPILGWL